MLSQMTTEEFLDALKASQGVKEKLNNSIAKIEYAITNNKVNQFSKAVETLESHF